MQISNELYNKLLQKIALLEKLYKKNINNEQLIEAIKQIEFNDPKTCFKEIISFLNSLHQGKAGATITFLNKKVRILGFTFVDGLEKFQSLVSAFHNYFFQNENQDNSINSNTFIFWCIEIIGKRHPENRTHWESCCNRLLELACNYFDVLYSAANKGLESEHSDIIILEWKNALVPKERKLLSILFSDMVSYSKMMGESEERTIESIQRYRQVLNHRIPEYKGEIYQFLGDRCVAFFTSVVESVEAAKSILGDLNETPIVSIRIGIHLGELLIMDGAYYGDSINIAARVQSTAEPGSVNITKEVYNEIKNQGHLSAEYLKTPSLKNITRKIDIFRLK